MRRGACVVGFNLNKAKAAKEEILKSFTPLDLNEGNVQAIFNRCLATKDDDIDNLSMSVLFQRDLGYDEDSKPVYFNKKKVEQNKQNIFYLLGQLRSVHSSDSNITSAESVYKYDDVQWTDDTVTLMMLYHLGETTKGILPFVKRSNTATIGLSIKPTLSPKDPAFPAWWEAHKSEWEA